MKKFPILYKRASTGKNQQWAIVVDNDKYYTISGQVGGKLTETKPSFGESKNIGKANETTAAEQALAEATSKWEYKLAHGYTKDLRATDNTGYKEPMLAKKFKDYADVVTPPFLVDDKLNGVRCNITRAGAKSRKGKTFYTIPHILTELEPIFEKYPDMFVDGELFNEDLKNRLNQLTELVSVAYQPKDVTPDLLVSSEQIVKFYVYDGFNFEDIKQNTPFVSRRNELQKLFKDFKYIRVLKYIACDTIKEVTELLAIAKEQKREGLIIRWGDCFYEFKRSKFLLKFKNWVTEEFDIVEIQEGDADWAGCAKRVVLKLPKPVTGRDGKEQTTFAAGIAGSMEIQRKLFQNRAKIEGKKKGSVTYGELSEYGIPLTPVMETVRDYE